jgi:hypothetical protein
MAQHVASRGSRLRSQTYTENCLGMGKVESDPLAPPEAKTPESGSRNGEKRGVALHFAHAQNGVENTCTVRDVG